VIDSGSRAERWVATRWPAIRARGLWHFVLLRGVLFWGGLMFVAMLVMMAMKFGITHPRFPLLVGVDAGLCLVGGLVWGLSTWFLNERLHRVLLTSKRLP